MDRVHGARRNTALRANRLAARGAKEQGCANTHPAAGGPLRRGGWSALWFAAALFLPLAACGGDFEQAQAAYDARDYARAREALAPLADAGDPRAQHLLGLLYEKGRGVEKDFTTAVHWYQRASQLGHAPSQYRLAVGYLCGLGGLPEDKAQALAWLRRSARGGYDKAKKVLATIESNGGEGVLYDVRVALTCWAFKWR